MAVKIIPDALQPAFDIPHVHPDIVIPAPYLFSLDGTLSDSEWVALRIHLPSAKPGELLEVHGASLDQARGRLRQLLSDCGVKTDD